MTAKNKAEASQDTIDYFKYLDLYMKEEQYWMQSHHSKIIYYTGLLTTMIGAIFFGFFNAKTELHFILISVASASMSFVAYYAIQAISRPFQRFIEAVAMRAKVEQLLRLDTLRSSQESAYWKDEGILQPRHVRDRQKYKATLDADGKVTEDASTKFVSAAMSSGFPIINARIFRIFIILGATSAVIGLGAAFCKLVNA